MADIDDFLNDDEPEPKKESMTGFLVALMIGTLVALGTGWFVGGQFADIDEKKKIEAEAKAAADKAKKEEEAAAQVPDDTEKKSEGRLVPLDPILVVLDSGDNTFLRLELALIFNEEADDVSAEGKAQLLSDLISFSRTISLSQISGPSGFLHLRDDLIDRARLFTNGDVKDVLILSMVAE